MNTVLNVDIFFTNADGNVSMLRHAHNEPTSGDGWKDRLLKKIVTLQKPFVRRRWLRIEVSKPGVYHHDRREWSGNGPVVLYFNEAVAASDWS